MPASSLDELGELQKAVMELVWELGQATVNDVRKKLGRRKKPAYTTILSVMQKLEKAGWLTHRAEGRAYVYLPTRSRAEVGRGSLRKFVDRVFGGDPLLMFQQLLAGDDIQADELAELHKMVEKRKRELKDC